MTRCIGEYGHKETFPGQQSFASREQTAQNVFGLPGTDTGEVERRIAFEIVESSEESPVPPENANLYSDKNAVTRNPETGDRTDGDMPYSRGYTEIKSIPGRSGEEAEPDHRSTDGVDEEASVNRNAESEYSVRTYQPESRFSRDLLLGNNSKGQTRSQDVPYDQQQTGTRDVGGISFNTYAWDFAPYLLELKQRIQRNIYPPPAFTQLGFGGNNILRFRIHPDGRLEGPQLLEQKGEKALVETSRKAVEFSAPFPSLPKDFPEPFLEVTARFEYFVIGRQ